MAGCWQQFLDAHSSTELDDRFRRTPQHHVHFLLLLRSPNLTLPRPVVFVVSVASSSNEFAHRWLATPDLPCYEPLYPNEAKTR